MNIEKLNNFAVKIFLSDSDLNAYNLCFQSMNSQNTADLVLSLTDEIMYSCGIDISDKKLIAEVFPQKYGCTIFLSFNPTSCKKNYSKIIFTVRLDCFENLKSFCRLLQRTPEYNIRSSSLYFDGSFLCLVILCDERTAYAVCNAAGKYGLADFDSGISDSVLAEHFICVESEAAVRKAAAI